MICVLLICSTCTVLSAEPEKRNCPDGDVWRTDTTLMWPHRLSECIFVCLSKISIVFLTVPKNSNTVKKKIQIQCGITIKME